MPRLHRCLSVAVLIGLSGLHVITARAAELTPAEVRQAIDAGVHYLKSRQGADGTWPDLAQMGGVTPLAALALLHARVPSQDPAIQKAVDHIARMENRFTYTVSLKIAVLARSDPKRYHAEIQSAADWLVRGQMNSGAWSYGVLDPRQALGIGDHSNTQYALLGLHEAAQAEALIPRRIWNRAQKQWRDTQAPDGGWSYVGRAGGTTGSMTAAGVASLIICGSEVNLGLENGYRNGAAPKCGKYRQDRAVAAGLNWLADHFSARRNPKGSTWHHYWLYGVERTGILAGLRYFGDHDWYREGAEVLVNSQSGGMGLFGGRGSWNRSIVDTAFALLFLAKGRRPVLFAKLKWSDDNEWNPDRHDCRNLVAAIGDDLGEPVSWQIVDLDAPVEEWLQAPILYIQGHEFPRFNKLHGNKLRRFVEAGGFLFAEACCSRPRFRKGFERFIQQTFPEHALRELESTHPVWHALHRLKPGRWPLFGLDSGCRTSIIFSPRDLSCLWEQADVPKLSDEAFRVGANIAAYATGREPLRDKLAEVTLPKRRRLQIEGVPVRGTLEIAQISHAGDWKPDPLVIPKLAEYLRKNANVTVVGRATPLRADDPRLLDHPIAYMSGHYAFELTPAERTGLRRYLQRGGFLFAEACCGREAFANSFQKLMGQLFPELTLKPIGPDHPIRSGPGAYHLDHVRYRTTLRREQPDLDEPVLSGLEINGRMAVVFSRWGIGCGIDDHQCYICRGVAPADARRIATNIILYALRY